MFDESQQLKGSHVCYYKMRFFSHKRVKITMAITNCFSVHTKGQYYSVHYKHAAVKLICLKSDWLSKFLHLSGGKIILKLIPKISFLCVVIVITVMWTSQFS